jgi:hypothetical protein
MQALHIPAYYDDEPFIAEEGLGEPEAELAPTPDFAEALDELVIQPLVVELTKEDDPGNDFSPETSLAIESIDPGKRLGIHYFPDSDHYSRSDMDLWLPVLKSIGIDWIVLQAPLDRAISQEFIEVMVSHQIQPIVHLNVPLTEERNVDEFAPMLRAYASWGVKHIVLFDRPNLRSMWPGQAWTQRDLVERFLARFVPLAHAALEVGLTPVFPALEPGGDYWDTAFLRSVLETMLASGEGLLLESLALGAYAWTEDKPMTWGAGGPENWPATLPYYTPEGSQDQRGFRIFDWYNAIARTVLGRELPIVIVAAGVQRESAKKLDAKVSTRAIKMAEALARPADNQNNAVPANVLACALWLMCADNEDSAAQAAWFEMNGKPSKIGREWLDWYNAQSGSKAVEPSKIVPTKPLAAESFAPTGSHYLLLSGAEFPMEAIRAFLRDNPATMGSSLDEAVLATHVTLVGGLQAFADDVIKKLIQAGCTLDALALEAA